MLKVHIVVTCPHCIDTAYLLMGEAEDCQGHKYIRHTPCLFCEGSDNKPKWIDLQDFAKLMQKVAYSHEHINFKGNLRKEHIFVAILADSHYQLRQI